MMNRQCQWDPHLPSVQMAQPWSQEPAQVREGFGFIRGHKIQIPGLEREASVKEAVELVIILKEFQSH